MADYGVRKYDSFTGRFMTADVLFEKFPAWNPYHYSLNNPISYRDGNGYKVTGTLNDLKYYEQAIEYFIENEAYDAAALLIEYQNNDTDVRLRTFRGEGWSSVGGTKGTFYTLHWYPNTAMKSLNFDNQEVKLSPAEILYHEINEIDIEEKQLEYDLINPNYENGADEQIIIGPECETREKCHPNDPKGPRKDHGKSGESYVVPDVGSTGEKDD